MADALNNWHAITVLLLIATAFPAAAYWRRTNDQTRRARHAAHMHTMGLRRHRKGGGQQ